MSTDQAYKPTAGRPAPDEYRDVRPGRGVLLVTTSYPTGPSDASGVFVARLARVLAVRYRVSVIAPAGTTRARSSQEPRGLVLPRLFAYAPLRWQVLAQQPGGIPVALSRRPVLYALVPGFLIAMFLATVRAVRGKDAVIANWSICGLVAGAAAKLRGVPTVTVIRGEDSNRARAGKVYRSIMAGAVALSARIVTVSEEMARSLKDMYPKRADQIIFVPNGADDGLLDLPEKTCANDSIFTVLTIGSLIPRKGVDTVLAAMVHAPENSLLKVVGNGPELCALQAQAHELGLDACVQFVGSVSPVDVPGLLAQCNVMVLASYSEGRPNVLLEALAAGRAIIATDIDGTRELIQHEVNGLLFAPGDIRALGRCLMRLAGEPELRRTLALNGRRSLLDRGLLWSQTGERYTEIIDQVIAETR